LGGLAVEGLGETAIGEQKRAVGEEGGVVEGSIEELEGGAAFDVVGGDAVEVAELAVGNTGVAESVMRAVAGSA
jgi:hypothetical protein